MCTQNFYQTILWNGTIVKLKTDYFFLLGKLNGRKQELQCLIHNSKWSDDCGKSFTGYWIPLTHFDTLWHIDIDLVDASNIFKLAFSFQLHSALIFRSETDSFLRVTRRKQENSLENVFICYLLIVVSHVSETNKLIIIEWDASRSSYDITNENKLWKLCFQR